ncbi:MAG: hypothetical protein K2O94_06760, partial [Clostridiales bacterium]|nr:hypothetical protein [Clostridiales bacterium]
PCVVTEYGIIATVKSFSPFMICVIDEAKAPKYKTLYVNVNGEGGKISDGEIRTFEQGDSRTYTVTPEEGYKVDKVILNGVAQQLTGNALTVKYDQLNGKNNSNELEVTFVAERVSTYRAENNLEIKQPKVVVRQSDMIEAVAPNAPVAPTTPGAAQNDSNVVGIVVGVVVAIVVVLVGGCLAFYFVMRNKKKAATANGASANGTKRAEVKAQPAKTEQPRKTETTATRPVAQNRPAPQNRPTPPVNRNTATPTANAPRNASPAKPAATTRPVAQNRPTANGNGQQRPPVSRNVRQDGANTARPNGNKPTNDRK